MKKLLLIIPALFLFLFVLPNCLKIRAINSDDCFDTSGGSPLCYLSGDHCRSRGFNCSNVLEDVPKGNCETTYQGCSETYSCAGVVYTSHIYCYLPKTATPIPTGCGYAGGPCCGTIPSNYYCLEGEGDPKYLDPSKGGSCTCQAQEIPVSVKNPPNKIYCDISGNPSITKSNRIYTAIGCIPFDTANNFLAAILKWAIGIGGGIAFILIIVASFMTMTSAGNPERLKAGQELLVAAISGLILLIFSVFILKIIGIDILSLPGLS